MLTALPCDDGLLYISGEAFYLTETAKLPYDRAVAMAITHFLSNSKMQKGLKPWQNSERVYITKGNLKFCNPPLLQPSLL